MKRKILSVVLASILILLTVPHTVMADSTSYTDAYGTVYRVSADGSYAIAVDGTNTSGSVKISSPVTINGKRYNVLEIDHGAFRNSAISELVLKSTLTTIGSEAFAGCNSLKTVQMNGASVSIGDRAFAGCFTLSEFLNSDEVTYIGAGALDDTPWYQALLASPTSVDGTISMGHVLYKYAGTSTNLRSMRNIITAIAPRAFEGNSTLQSVTLGKGIKTIGNAAFRNCSALTTVSYTNSTLLETIGNSAFDGCTKLTGSLVLPSTVRSIGSHAFKKTAYTSADLSAVATSSVPSGLFAGCTSLTSVSLPNSVTTVGASAFSGASSLESITLPNIIYIDYDAFRGCASLSDKNAFSTVEYIGTGAFDGTPIYNEANGKACVIGNVLYKTEQSDISTFTVQNGIKAVSPYALYNAEKLSTLSLPSSLVTIDADAVPFNEDTDIILFSQNDSAYTSLSNINVDKIIVPDGNKVENENASVYTISGLSLERYPKKINYSENEQFDPTGIILNVNATGTDDISYNIEDIGYAPEYTYDFSKSENVTVNYNGYTLDIDLSKGHFVKGAQIRAKTDKKDQGLRFVAEYADAYAANYENCEFGFAIIPSSFVPDGEKVEAGKVFEIDGKHYAVKTVPAANIFEVSEGHIAYTVCITGTTVKNYGRKYTVVPYVKNVDGAYIYGDSYETSIIDVASAIAADPNASADDKKTANDILEQYENV